MGKTLMPCHSCHWPRTLVMETFSPKKNSAATAPRGTMIWGAMSSICFRSQRSVQILASSGRGARFPGGRHLTMLVM
jgi:hypothetical protein